MLLSNNTHGQVSTALPWMTWRNQTPARCSSNALLCTQIEPVSDIATPDYKPGTAVLGQHTWICSLSVILFPSHSGGAFIYSHSGSDQCNNAAVHLWKNQAVRARNSGGIEPAARGQRVGNLRRGCGCVCVGGCVGVCVACVVHACGSPLCHGEEGWRKKAVALNKNVFIFKGEGGRLWAQFVCLVKHCKRIFHHLKATRKEKKREREREVQLRETAS